MKKFIDIKKLNDFCGKSHGFALKDGAGFQCIVPDQYIIIYGYFDNNIFKMDYESDIVKRHNIYIGSFNLKTVESILDKIL